MRVSVSRASGRADPFGLLVLAVMLALSVTIGIQAQASGTDARVSIIAPALLCEKPCLTLGQQH